MLSHFSISMGNNIMQGKYLGELSRKGADIAEDCVGNSWGNAGSPCRITSLYT